MFPLNNPSENQRFPGVFRRCKIEKYARNDLNISNVTGFSVIYLVRTQNFPQNEHFLPPDTHTYICISGGKK